ncbi:unnamed protein product, partial [marine sediment metagenome]
SSRNYKSYRTFLKYLKVVKGKRLLDVSCGTGKLLRVAEEHGLITFGIDLSEKAIEKAKEFANNSKIDVGNAEDLPYPDRYFDYITNLGSLEHYLNPDSALSEMLRVLKDDGKLCIMVPNSYYLFDIIHVLKYGCRKSKTGQIQEKLAPKGEWIEIIKNKNFEVLEIYRDREPIDISWRKVFSNMNLKHIFDKIMEKLLQNYMPLNLGYQFIFICKKRN